MAILNKSSLVKAYWSIKIIKRAHLILHQAYQIIIKKLQDLKIIKELALQIAVKIINNTAGPDGLVPTLFVFSAYPQINKLNPLAPFITQQMAVIKKAMEEIAKIRAKKQINDALN